MFGSVPSHSQMKERKREKEKEWVGASFKPENFVPGLIIGFLLGLFWDLTKPTPTHTTRSRRRNFLPGKQSDSNSEQCLVPSNCHDQDLKMVLVVRQDLKMGSGKVASQCAHAATGMYSELMQSDRYLLRKWEQCGQPKIVCTCRNQQEMNKLREAAEGAGLPTFVVADAGRTQVEAGSKTVLAIGPGPKSLVDTITGKLRLL